MNKMTINISKQPDRKAALIARPLGIRERIFRLLFGPIKEVIVLVPGSQIKEIEITKKKEN